MSEALTQKSILFYGDEVIAVQRDATTVFVVFSLLCSNLGLERTSQVRRVRRHEVLRKGVETLPVATEGGTQQMQCLRLDLLPLWLSGLQAGRVKPELREHLTRYQREAAFVLWDAFKPQILEGDSALVPANTEYAAAIQELQRIAEMGRAMAQMAEQQIELQRQQQALAQRLDKAGQVVKGIQTDVGAVQIRLGVLEDRLHPAAYITEEQATQVSTTVKALAEVLTRTEGKNQYQGVFAELYRRFGVSGYKLIRQEQYEAVLAFLEDWRAAADDGYSD